MASAFPIADCEIGDGDSAVLVDARIHGSGSLPYTYWDREPQPVVDLRFDVQPSFSRRVSRFLVFRPADLERKLNALASANADSWLEVRTFRSEFLRFGPQTVPTYQEAMALVSSPRPTHPAAAAT